MLRTTPGDLSDTRGGALATTPGVWAAGGFLAVYSYWFAVYCGAGGFAKRFFMQTR